MGAGGTRIHCERQAYLSSLEALGWGLGQVETSPVFMAFGPSREGGPSLEYAYFIEMHFIFLDADEK